MLGTVGNNTIFISLGQLSKVYSMADYQRFSSFLFCLYLLVSLLRYYFFDAFGSDVASVDFVRENARWCDPVLVPLMIYSDSSLEDPGRVLLAGCSTN